MKIEIINKCPCCRSNLERVKDQLFCRNKSCEAQNSKRVENFTKKAKIKGFGSATITKLGIETIPGLYNITKENLVQAVGQKVADKLELELEKSKRMSLATFIAALSIPLIGNSAANKLAINISSIEEITKESCINAGLGEKATASLMHWKLEEYPNYYSVPINFSSNTSIETAPTKSIGISVCCTGRIEGHTRSTLSSLLSSLGVKVTTTVTNNTNFLICEELKGSSKEKKAESIGVEIITLTELINRI